MGEVESKKGGRGRRATAPELAVTAYNREVEIKSSIPKVTLGHGGAAF